MAIVPTPTYPISGDTVSLAIDVPVGNTTVLELTVVPDDSTIAPTVQERVQTGRKIQDAVDDESASEAFTPDQPGAYTWRAYEYASSPGSPAFPGDPAGEATDVLVANQSTTIYVGALMDLPLVTVEGDGADLRLQVNDGTVRAASLQNFRTNNAQSAAEQTAVVAALAALVGTSVSTIGANLETAIIALHGAYTAHIADAATVHIAADGVNTLSLSEPSDHDGAILVLNEISLKYRAHATGSSSGAGWHRESLDDLENLPVAAEATDKASATVLYADLAYRGYARHLDAADTPAMDPEVHDNADTTNTIAAATLLDAVIRDFFDALVGITQTAQRGENSGDIQATILYGFVRAD